MIGVLPLIHCVLSDPLPIAWGLATSAYQIEGAWNSSGKGISIWDKWYLDPSRQGNPNGFIAANHYNNMKSDISLLGQLGATAYRFSVSWPRILPDCSGAVNPEGIQFYSDMIDEIIRNGALPVLTLFHWDTPQACHDKYGSWSSKLIVDDFTNYADVVFQNFGDRLQYVLTLNEPSAECLIWHLSNLAHGSVVQMARRKHGAKNLKFGMPLIVSYGLPLTDSAEDLAATNRFMDYQIDWNWGPITNGDYPDYMKANPEWGPFLPAYTESEKLMMKGTMDFVALNYYSATYIKSNPAAKEGYDTTLFKNGQIIGPVSGTSWQNIYPVGIRGLSRWIADKYKMDIFITECGTSVANEPTMTLSQIIDDKFRLNFFTDVTRALADAVLVDKTPIKAFLAWALLDNFEWNTYDQRFGVVSIDYTNGTLERHVKNSANFLKTYFAGSKSPFTLPAPSNGKSVGSVTAGGTGSVGTPASKSIGYHSSFDFILFLLMFVFSY